MVKYVIGAVAIEVVFRQRHPVDGESDAIFACDIPIEATVVLDGREGGWINGVVIGDVGYSTQRAARGSTTGASSAASRVLTTRPAEILRPQAGGQWRANINSLARNCCTIHAFNQAGSSASSGRIKSSQHRIARKRKILGCDASGRCQGVESRRIVPSITGKCGVGLAHGLIVEKSEDLIFPDRAADATAELAELVVVSLDGQAVAVEALIGVEVGLVGCEEEAAVKIIAAALGSDLQLGTAEAAILGVIAIGDDFNAFDRILRWRYDRRATPDGTRGTDTIDGYSIVLSLISVGNDLRAILGLEDAIVTSGSASPD